MTANCPVCHDNAFLNERHINSNVDGLLDKRYAIRTCANCGLTYTFPQPSPEALTSYYSGGVYQKSGGRLGSMIDVFLRIQMNMRLNEIAWYQRPGKLLDVGCGKGRFMAQSINYGWQTVGIDLTASQLRNAKMRYGATGCAALSVCLPFANETFDVVTGWHNVEHIADPVSMFTEVGRILKPGGVVVIEVPNIDSWQARLGREHWFQLDVPRHLCHYSLDSLKIILSQTGFKVVRYSSFSMELGLYGMIQTTLNKLNGEPNWFYRWLKRSLTKPSLILLGKNLLLLLICIIPAVALELVASIFRKGGVLRVIGIKIS